MLLFFLFDIVCWLMYDCRLLLCVMCCLMCDACCPFGVCGASFIVVLCCMLRAFTTRRMCVVRCWLLVAARFVVCHALLVRCLTLWCDVCCLLYVFLFVTARYLL